MRGPPITTPLLGVRSIVVSIYSRISHVGPRAYLRNHWSELHQIFCACYLWPWLSPSPAALRYVMYVRFVNVIFARNGQQWKKACSNWLTGGNTGPGRFLYLLRKLSCTSLRVWLMQAFSGTVHPVFRSRVKSAEPTRIWLRYFIIMPYIYGTCVFFS